MLGFHEKGFYIVSNFPCMASLQGDLSSVEEIGSQTAFLAHSTLPTVDLRLCTPVEYIVLN